MTAIRPSAQEIAQAAAVLRAGRLVAFPTESVYGLGADATQDAAVARIFEAKGRPRFNPLIVHVPDITAADAIGVLSPVALKLARAFWPGPLTLVIPMRAEARISDLVTAGLDTIAIRVPSHPVARELLVAAGCPIAAPSANISGRVSATTAAHVHADFGDQDVLVLDGGATQHGMESTIVDASTASLKLLRPGAIATEDIVTVAGAPLVVAHGDAARPSAPGQLESHYAPNAAVRLNVRDPRPDEALLAFGPDVPPHAGPVINLSPTGNTTEAAIGLFAALRTLDASGCLSIAVMPIPESGLGEAINDRLRRAAAPRP